MKDQYYVYVIEYFYYIKIPKFRCVITYSDNNGNSLPVNFPSDISYQLFNNKINEKTLDSIEIPDFFTIKMILNNDKFETQKDTINNLTNIYDYIGSIECNVNYVLDGLEKEPFISKFSPINEYEKSSFDEGIIISSKGYFNNLLIQKLIQILIDKEKENDIPFFILNSYGIKESNLLQNIKSQYLKSNDEIENKSFSILHLSNNFINLFSV